MSSRLLRSLLAAAGMALAGCGASSSGNGVLAVALTDAPTDDVKGIVVTIDTVTAHSEQAGWVTVAQGPLKVDLLTLQDVSMKLGEVSLPAGTVTEIRLILADGGPQYVVLSDDSHAPLKTPSGSESGLKLKGSFTVSACVKHTVTLDFDGKNSIAFHETGSPNGWILRPVIRVKAEADEAGSCSADGGTSDSGTQGGTDGGTTGGSDGGTSGTPDGGLSCPGDPSCPPMPN